MNLTREGHRSQTEIRTTKPRASLSLDLDDKWSYLKTHGDPAWASLPSYLDIVVPRVLKILKDRGLTITFFIVGLDADQERNRDVLRSIADAGHEIGNHSYHHEPWLHLYTEARIEAELARTEDALEAATWKRPVGFRGPGFSLSEAVLRVLVRRGYEYDCSTFPTFLGPLARAYYFATSKLSAAQKKERAQLFGKLGEGFRPLTPYRWALGAGRLTEIPVTTMPIFKLPFHLSYLIYLGCYSRSLAKSYFRWALRLCRLSGTAPSLLLHPLDFLGRDDTCGLDFFPAMQMESGRKLELVHDLLDEFTARFAPVPVRDHAAAAARSPLMARRPAFS